ncbi:MAG: hydantoinase B/oxoprolinase family protein, partial [Thermodesulfobacteriota bacterium]|nr:hydantoinase B/oxoprolinase family protein [Thermodesulfobacteriota bacterium]
FRQQRDTSGPGKYRGGSGAEMLLTPHQVPWLAFNSISSGSRVKQTSGLFGGYIGSTSPGVQVTGTNYFEKLASGDKDLPVNLEELVSFRSIKGNYSFESTIRSTRVLQPGDIFCLAGAGGGGYGDVLERDPDAVMEDIKNGIISHWTAQNVYMVAYDPDSQIVDHKKTDQLRSNFREERKRIGKKYDEFMQEWSKQKPPEEALKFYGSWPDAKKLTEIIRI